MIKRLLALSISFCTALVLHYATQAKPVPALSVKPVIVYLSATGESDKAFVAAALVGAQRAKTEFGIQYNEFRIPKDRDVHDAIQSLAKKGYSPIIAVGYQNVLPVHNLAEKFPDTQFNVIDGLVPPLYTNVQSSVFKDHEGAFLVGMIAAYASKNHHIAFIGGMDVPLIRNFAKGYKQGANYAKQGIRVDVDMIGTTALAWSSPEKAFALAQDRFGSGADVIFAAAGGSGLGVLRAAEAADAMAIGVDTNQNALYPGHVLTSLVKRVDIAVYEALKDAQIGNWQPGIKLLGLKEGALDYAVDQNNKDLLTADMIEKVSNAKERIINGLIEVDSYSVR